jgi:hypothetical protein
VPLPWLDLSALNNLLLNPSPPQIDGNRPYGAGTVPAGPRPTENRQPKT